MLKILRIDSGAAGGPKATVSSMGESAGLGGRALTSALIAREVPPLCHPLGAQNKLVFAPGILGGTTAAMSGRLSVGAKSPLTGGIMEAGTGGQPAHVLARLGYGAIVLEGKPESDDVYKVYINKDEVRITVDNNLKKMPNYVLAEKMKEEYGGAVALISIGPAGEMKLGAASVACTDMELRPTRHAGSGGLGAVMGSKGIKVIVLDDCGLAIRVPKETDRFEAANAGFVHGLKHHPVTGKCLPAYGTNVITNVINEAGLYPTFNFRQGRFEKAYLISGETQVEMEKARGGLVSHGCQEGCVVGCSGIFNDKNGNYLTKQLEYETVWAHGANCGICDLDAIAMLDFMDDNFGLDSVEMGAAIAIAMEAGLIEFADSEGAIEMVRQVGLGTPLGRILGSGAAAAGKIFGIERVPVIKGQALPGYDPRGMEDLGIIYATSPVVSHHAAGCAVAAAFLWADCRTGSFKPGRRADLMRNIQVSTAALDSTGMCFTVADAVHEQPGTLQSLVDMINAFCGLSMNEDDFLEVGKKVLKLERDFNRAAGFTCGHDRLPGFFKVQQLAPHDVVFTIPDEELDEVFNW